MRRPTDSLEVRVGAFRAILINDGDLYAEPRTLFTNADPAEIASATQDRLDGQGRLRAPRNVLFLQAADSRILIDTGFGPFAAAAGLTPSRLRDALSHARVQPDAIEHVVLTHGHGDHIGGVADGGELAFPRAIHYIHAAEQEFWMTSASAAQPEPLRMVARQQLSTLERSGRLEVVHRERELATGVYVEPAPGHTPGHMIVALESGGESAMYIADAVLDPSNFANPHHIAVMDVSSEQTPKTRMTLLVRAARHHSLLLAGHLDQVGYVERAGGAFRFRPVLRLGGS